uniref:Uncharacterized protein n=1 Tax=Kangiella spongicola TaxID=796379 RepID=A0A318D636_9GAMM
MIFIIFSQLMLIFILSTMTSSLLFASRSKCAGGLLTSVLTGSPDVCPLLPTLTSGEWLVPFLAGWSKVGTQWVRVLGDAQLHAGT